jgi:hypothetical protein
MPDIIRIPYYAMSDMWINLECRLQPTSKYDWIKFRPHSPPSLKVVASKFGVELCADLTQVCKGNWRMVGCITPHQYSDHHGRTSCRISSAKVIGKAIS